MPRHRAIVVLAFAGCAPPAPRTQAIMVGDGDARPVAVAAEPRAPTTTTKAPSVESGSGVGQQAPPVRGGLIGGEGPHDVGAARGRVTIVHFWATFCVPCRTSLGEFQTLADRHGKHVAVIAVALDAPQDVMPTDLRDFAVNAGARYAIVWDLDHSTAESYQIPQLPTTYVIDRQGIVRHIHPGHTSEDAARIGEEVRRLLR